MSGVFYHSVRKEKEGQIISTILIMDEDEAIRMLYEDVFSEEGYEVIACGNPVRLMELIACRRPDLLIMEAMLTNGDGLDLLQDISSAFRKLPVVLCTTCPAFKEDLRSLAAHGFVVKSSNLKPLKAALKAVLEGRQPTHPAPLPACGDLPEPMS
jgi:DNA-binding response OmpR family regulator